MRRTLAAIGSIALAAAAASAQLVINEVDYDSVGLDTSEFIELYNRGTTDIFLGDYSVVLVNGASNNTYQVIPLPQRWLPPGLYWVIAGGGGLVPGTNQPLVLTENIIQNGAPDGTALVNNLTSTLADAVSYEGCMTACAVTGLTGPINLVEGTCLSVTVFDDNTTAARGLARLPNGADSNDSSSDWALATTTPGAKNGSACPGPVTAPISIPSVQTCPTGGSDVSFTVSPTGPGGFTYQWRKDGIWLANNATYAGVTTSTLGVIAPGAAEAGIYDCIVTNSCIPMLSDAAVIQSCIADANCSDGVDLNDFFDFLTCFDQSLDCADIDGLPGVDLNDFFSFLTAFDQGC